MDANPFDQFDEEAAPAQSAAANPFDQFDAPAAAAQATHPIAGPSGDVWTDVKNRLATAGTDALNGVNEMIRPFREAQQSALRTLPPAMRQTMGADQPLPDPATARDQAFNATGATEYVPETFGGRMGQAALTAAAMAPLGGGAALKEIAASVPSLAAGGATSEAAGELFPNHPDVARILGFLPGAWGAKAALNLPLSPTAGAVDPETAALAKSAQDKNIPIAAGQISNNPFVRYFYSETKKLPFSGADEYAGTQQDAFTRGVSQTFGENADKITPDVLQSAKDRIGGVMNDVASRTTIDANKLIPPLSNIESNARLVLPDSDWGPVSRQLDNVLSTVKPGDTISGESYQALTKKGGAAGIV